MREMNKRGEKINYKFFISEMKKIYKITNMIHHGNWWMFIIGFFRAAGFKAAKRSINGDFLFDKNGEISGERSKLYQLIAQVFKNAKSELIQYKMASNPVGFLTSHYGTDDPDKIAGFICQNTKKLVYLEIRVSKEFIQIAYEDKFFDINEYALEKEDEFVFIFPITKAFITKEARITLFWLLSLNIFEMTWDLADDIYSYLLDPKKMRDNKLFNNKIIPLLKELEKLGVIVPEYKIKKKKIRI
jgi:hypothetical protein